MSKRTVRLTESELRNMIMESVNRILNENEAGAAQPMSVSEFTSKLYEDHYETLLNLYKEAVNEFVDEDMPQWYADYFMGTAEEMAELTAKQWTEAAIELLNGNDWNYPPHNFRTLDFVMGEQGINSFQDLLAMPNPVEIFVDWFWDAFGTWGTKYNFQEVLTDEYYELERENGENEDE